MGRKDRREMEEGVTVVVLPAEVRASMPMPPSVNQAWRCVGGHNILSADYRAWRQVVSRAMADRMDWVSATLPRPLFPEQRLEVVIELCFDSKRRSDIDNRVKAVLDVLTHTGVYGDDSQVDKLVVSRGNVQTPAMAYCTINVVG